MLVVMKADDERFGLKAGDALKVMPYRYEPDCKLTVLYRLSDRYDPECNVYHDQVRPVANKANKKSG